jgi:hypothetical protein
MAKLMSALSRRCSKVARGKFTESSTTEMALPLSVRDLDLSFLDCGQSSALLRRQYPQLPKHQRDVEVNSLSGSSNRYFHHNSLPQGSVAEESYAEYRRQKASGSGGRGFRLPLW